MYPFDPRVFRAANLDRGTGFHETRGDLRKIFHGGPEYGDFAERRRLQDVVPAGIHQRTTDKRSVGQTVERGQLSNAVQQDNRDVIGDAVGVPRWLGSHPRPGDGKLRAADKFPVRFFDEFGGGGEALRFPRREHEQGISKVSLDDAECDQGQRLFDQTFSSAASAQAFFNNDVLDLGLLTSIPLTGSDLDLIFNCSLVASNNSGADFNFVYGNGTPQVIPLPGSALLLLTGLAGLGILRKKGKAKKS